MRLTGRGGRRVAIAAAAVAGAVALFLVAPRAAGLLVALSERARALGPAGAAVYVAVYAVATVALVPGSVLTLAAGALYGLAAGSALAFGGAVVGSTLAFLVARHLASGPVRRWLGDHPRLEAVYRSVAREGRKIVLLLRLSPVVPFNALNYLLGLTRVRLRDYLLASAGMLPATVLYVYYGKLAGDVAAVAHGGEAAPRGAGYWAVTVVGLAATVLAVHLVTRAARRALRQTAVEVETTEQGPV